MTEILKPFGTIEKVCLRCGGDFVPCSNRQKYCTYDCRRGTGICKGCGKAFQKTSDIQHYCTSECYFMTGARTANRVCLICGNEANPGRKYCSYECGNEAKRIRRVKINCITCGKEFETKESINRKYCSRTCSLTGRNRTGERVRKDGDIQPDSAGYLRQKHNGKWVMQHRLIMEQILGRSLEKHERIHHKNGNRSDNREENLELWKIKGKDPAGVRASDYHCAGCRCYE